MPYPGDATNPPKHELTPFQIRKLQDHDWPAESPRIQERVTIDFAADANEIVSQDPMEFQAIRPNGAYYEYRDYGAVESLQDTLKNASASPQ